MGHDHPDEWCARDLRRTHRRYGFHARASEGAKIDADPPRPTFKIRTVLLHEREKRAIAAPDIDDGQFSRMAEPSIGRPDDVRDTLRHPGPGRCAEVLARQRRGPEFARGGLPCRAHAGHPDDRAASLVSACAFRPPRERPGCRPGPSTDAEQPRRPVRAPCRRAASPVQPAFPQTLAHGAPTARERAARGRSCG